MKERTRISVCMATYNGGKYILPQLKSILSQIGEEDEVIISDDGSVDNTIEVIESLNDKRIIIIRNSFKNVVKNFEFALNMARGDIIFLSDQDDIWMPNKVSEILNIFSTKPQTTLILTNAEFLSEDERINGKLYFQNPPQLNFLFNLAKNNFLGCTMAFRNNIKQKIYPFPANLAMHDWWIGLNNILYGTVYFINEPLVNYRRHAQTVTNGKRSPIIKGIKWRGNIVINILQRWIK